jgi:putative redox protein
MQSSTLYLGGKKFSTQIGHHQILTDQPEESGGENQAPTPPDLLLASLGACAAHYAMEYLSSRSLSTEGLHVQVFAEKTPRPVYLDNFRIVVETRPLDEKHRQGLARAVDACLIHRTLHAQPKIEVEFATSRHELAARGVTALSQT